ncbi:hypothetical protein TRSC58_02016 [Trypanosoma rangeli SC58]|uniref:Mucin-associated surface protein (MASP) n=1 Tax=Trypanosoma rangeli SC58 TaxID=429131 RepID=A0A061J5V5_TRYRA|nr:hypothetical protein TRSC58_02016 [Trypanosoma rangeli SC58]
MAGRVLLVCALCVLCCGGGVGAWHDYCNERDWRDLRVINESRTDEELLDRYCNQTFANMIKNKLAAAKAKASAETISQGQQGMNGLGAEGKQTSASEFVTEAANASPTQGGTAADTGATQHTTGGIGADATQTSPSVGGGPAGSGQAKTPPPPAANAATN